MKKSKKPRDPDVPKGPRGPTKPNGEGERPKHRPHGREHQVHQEILDRRLRGGPKPTAQRYAHALEQWKNLPGSIVRPPTDVALPVEEGTSEDEDQEGNGGNKAAGNEGTP